MWHCLTNIKARHSWRVSCCFCPQTIIVYVLRFQITYKNVVSHCFGGVATVVWAGSTVQIVSSFDWICCHCVRFEGSPSDWKYGIVAVSFGVRPDRWNLEIDDKRDVNVRFTKTVKRKCKKGLGPFLMSGFYYWFFVYCF